MNINEIVYLLLEELKKLPNGIEISTFELSKKVLPNLEISNEDMFEINEQLFEKAESQGIILDQSKYDGAILGLPFHIPFIKYTK